MLKIKCNFCHQIWLIMILILSLTYEKSRNINLGETSLNIIIPETASIEDDTHMKKYYDESSISNN